MLNFLCFLWRGHVCHFKILNEMDLYDSSRSAQLGYTVYTGTLYHLRCQKCGRIKRKTA